MRRVLAAASIVLAVVLALGAGGCSRDFDPSTLINKLRLLAVKAEPPNIPFGATTTMTATAFAPAATPTITWDACLLAPVPGSGEAVNEDCVGLPEGDPSLLPFGTGDTVTATMPTLDSTMVGLPDQSDGVYLPVRMKLDIGDGHPLTAFYQLRIYLSGLDPNPPNQNPTLTGIFQVPSADAGMDQDMMLDPSTPTGPVHANDEIDLRALISDDSQETYEVFDGDPATTPPRSVTEAVTLSWYATAGEFTNTVTGMAKPDTTLKLDKYLPASSTLIDLWVVARDERGGSDIMHRQLQFE
jgi:hypothetical protein